MTIELTIKEALDLQFELTIALKKLAPNELKFLLADLLIEVKNKTQAGAMLLDEIFKKHGRTNQVGQVEIQMWKDDDIIKKEKTDQYKAVDEIHSRLVKLEAEMIPLDLYKKMEESQDFFFILYSKFVKRA